MHRRVFASVQSTNSAIAYPSEMMLPILYSGPDVFLEYSAFFAIAFTLPLVSE
jgi:hypothetical protein